MTAITASRPPARHGGLILAGLCLAAFIISLDSMIVNVALPSLVREIGATTTGLQWVVDAYNLSFAALVLAAGGLSDRLGRKGMLLSGLAVFGSASLAGSFATSTAGLIAARAVMGAGAAMMFPSTLSLMTNVFTDRRERARAIGLWGATTGAGIASGPIIGGALLEHFWWGSVFLFMAPVAGIVAAGVAMVVPTSRDPSTPPVDWRGLILSAIGMGLLVFGVIEAPAWGWASARSVGTLAGGAAILAVFVAVEGRTAQPMLDVSLFRNPRFTAASASVAIAFFALQGFIFLMTQYFQVVNGYAPLSSGVRLLPVAGAVAVAAVLGTRLAVRAGNKAVVAGGLTLYCAALAWMSTSSQGSSYALIAAAGALLGAGMGLTQAPATEAIMGAVPSAKAGIGSAVNDATRLFGGTLGVAVVGSVAASLYSSRLAALLPRELPAPAAAAARGSVGGAVAAAHVLDRAGRLRLAGPLDHAGIVAFLHSFAGGCLVASGVAAIGAVLAGSLLPARPGAPRPGTAADRHPRVTGLSSGSSGASLPL
jgi:EmrB/QacA subfamily drug resistance transporter